MTNIKYNLNCGTNYMDGYINCNPEEIPDTKIDFKADMLTMDFPWDGVEEIRIYHAFEHYGYVDAYFLLTKWTLALQRGGSIVIEVPDMYEITMHLREPNITKHLKIMRLVFGDQASDNGFHKSGWTEESLSEVMKAFGYRINNVIKTKNYRKNFPNAGFRVSASKMKDFDRNLLKEIAFNFLLLYANEQEDVEEIYAKQLAKRIETLPQTERKEEI